MTNAADLRRLTLRIINSADIVDVRISHAVAAIALDAADGHPATASGAQASTGGTAELTPTEAAAHTNLGDLWGYSDTPYHPGPTIRLGDVEDALRACLLALDLAHRALTACGTPPLLTHKLRCRGVNGQGCPDWASTGREDGLCIDCGRAKDANRRCRQRHQWTA